MDRPYNVIGREYTARISLFDGASGKEPLRTVEFESLAEMARAFGRSVEAERKQRAPLYSRCAALGGRERDDLIAPYQIVLDVDGSPISMAECSARLDELGVAHFGYTTWKHSPDVLELHNYRIVTDLLAEDWRTVEGLTRELSIAIEVEIDPVSAHQICFYLPASDGRRRVERVARVEPSSSWAPDPTEWDDLELGPDPGAEDEPERDPDTIDVEEVREALSFIPNEERSQWIRTGQCLHGSGHEDARELWDDWSQGQDYGDFSHEAQERAWASFGGRGLGISSVFFDARENGWSPAVRRQTAAEEFTVWEEDEDVEHAGGWRADRNRLLAQMSSRYSYVAVGQGKVWDETNETLMSKPAFLDYWTNPTFPTGRIIMGEEEMEPIGRTWWKYPGRPRYSIIDFAPPGADVAEGAMNLWRGWGVDPVEGSCSRLKDHLHEVICSADDDLYEWIIDWCAHLVQRPAEKPGTAIVMRSEEGTGKGFFGRTLCQLAGTHGMHVTQPSLLTGRFTQHLANKLMIFADEVTWGGRRQESGVLKALITEDTMPIEAKGVDAYSARSFCRVVVASNQDWVVPAGPNARRFLVLDVSEKHRRDYAYFARLKSELESGGIAAFHHELLQHDLGEANVHDVIRTAALLRQKLEGLEPITSWIVDRLIEGRVGCFVAWGEQPVWVQTRQLYDSYQGSARDQGLTRRATEMKVARTLRDLFGRLPKRRNVDEEDGITTIEVQLPGLKDARAMVDAMLDQAVGWDSEGEHTLD